MADEINSDASFDDRLNSVVDTLMAEEDKKPAEQDPAADAAPGEAEQPVDQDAIGEDKTKDKPNKEGQVEPAKDPAEEPGKAIEPPTSWPTDDKEAFKALPTWAQERIVARENEREAYFSERSRTIAAKEREMSEVQNRATEAQRRLSTELDRLNELAVQLLPAKFADIRSEADYLRVKSTDPARASEYEAFMQVLGANAEKQKAVQAQRMQEQLNREYAMLTEKFPEFKDTAKAKTILDEVRKTAVEYYGFSPQEVQIIADHRHVQVLRDAKAWRQYQANLKAAAGKKVPAQPTPMLKPNGAATGSSVASDQKAKILNRAKGKTDLRERADLVASLL
jgi:hypothetical protein